MKISTVQIIAVLFASAMLINCGGNKTAKPVQEVSDTTALRTPTKEILVTAGDINKKYTILGKIDYTMKGNSVYSDQIEANKQAEESLKKVAYSKYGDKVDAIINTKSQATMKGGFWGAVGAGYGARNMVSSIEGLAVSFEDGQNAAEATSTKSESLEATKKPVYKSKRKSRKVR
jgi:hypothetical protein